MKLKFMALDYTSEGTFIESEYEYSGNISNGWLIRRNGVKYLTLGPGYRLLKTKICGICATDLSRRFLPFPLPQILGHEVVAVDPDTSKEFVVEINDTCAARGDPPELFCKSGLITHCPGRMVLGIDRLPGGFGPYILAPVNAAIPSNGIPSKAAALAEPFAAALHAVTVSPPRADDRVAVLGTGKLGLLLIAALALYRKTTGIDFCITALARQGRNCELAGALGADTAIDMRGSDPGTLRESQDIVFDASGSTIGFQSALDIAVREVHLKSTHGREFHGIKHLTEMVVDELSLLPFSERNLDFHWNDENRENETIFMGKKARTVLPENYKAFYGSIKSAEDQLTSDRFRDRLPRYDACIVSSAGEIDSCIRPDPSRERSLVRPRGAILFQGNPRGNPLLAFLASGKRVRTSRCGSLREAIRVLKNETDTMQLLESHLITHIYDSHDLPFAYESAKSYGAIKILIRHF